MAHAGTLHAYTSRLTAFEHASPNTSSTKPNTNIIIWIGGLGDGLLCVDYPSAIVESLPPTWSLAEVLLSSSYKGWATGSLARDARELGNCVKYFKRTRPGAKIVLMGHSTGCQDVMEYLCGKGKEDRERIDGAILQAGVSDREAFEGLSDGDEDMKKKTKDTYALAKKMVEAGDGNEMLPRKGNPVSIEFGGVAMTAYRLHSLLTPGGDDDYFSSDLSDDVFKGTFGKIPKETRVMLLWGEKDPYVPDWVDREGILKRWIGIVKEGGGNVDEVNSGVIEGASHNLNGDFKEVVQDLVKRVVAYLKGVDGESSRL